MKLYIWSKCKDSFQKKIVPFFRQTIVLFKKYFKIEIILGIIGLIIAIHYGRNALTKKDITILYPTSGEKSGPEIREKDPENLIHIEFQGKLEKDENYIKLSKVKEKYQKELDSLTAIDSIKEDLVESINDFNRLTNRD